MPSPANLVHALSSGTGTGDLAISDAFGKQSFDAAFGHGSTTDVFDYFISHRTAAEWEFGTGHLSDAGTLVRDTVIESSNGNSVVDFSAGVKDITNDVPASGRILKGDRAAIKAFNTSRTTTAYLTEASRQDFFAWDSSDLSAMVTLDSQEGVYVPPSSDSTGVSGAWVRTRAYALSVRSFGAKGDGVTDDTVAIQAALDFVMGLSVARPAIYLPAGTYKISSDLTLSATVAPTFGIRIFGDGKRRSVIKAATGVSKMLKSLAATSSGRHERINLEGLDFDGNNIATHGFYAAYAAHGTYRSLRFIGMNGGADIAIGWAFCSVFDDIESVSVNAHGIDLRENGQANACLISNCKLLLHKGFGLLAVDCMGLKILNNDIEANTFGGIFLQGYVRGFSIDGNYFEKNGATGWTFTSPAITVKADIIVNGASGAAGADQTLAAAFTGQGGIRDCFRQGTDIEAFVYATGADTLDISGNDTADAIPLIKCYGGSGTSPSNGVIDNFRIGPNKGFSRDIEIDPISAGVLNYGERPTRIKSHSALNLNIANTRLDTWTVVSASGGGDWQLSSEKCPFDPNIPVWELSLLSSGSSDIRGFSIDAADYPQFQGKLVAFGAWVKCPYTAADGGVWIYGNGVANSSSYESVDTWQFKSVIWKMPSSGSKICGVRKVGASGAVQITSPVLCELGADMLALGAFAAQDTGRNYVSKAYADQLLAAQDAMVFKGVIDCSANPNYPAADRGHTYRVSVAGKIGGASGDNVEAGDLLICLTDSTSAGTKASVGSNWTIAQTNLDGAVIGPSSVTDGHAVLFNGSTGKLVKSAGYVPADNSAVVKLAGSQQLAGGFDSTVYDAGTKSSGTFTPSYANQNIQKCVNGGAFALGVPSGNGSMILDITNNGSAGNITTSAYTKKTGDPFDTTNGHGWRCYITTGQLGSHLHVTAMF